MRAIRARDTTLILASLLLMVSLGAGLLFVGRPDRGVALQRLETQVPYPILFIHGFGGTGKGWVDSGLTDYLEQSGLRFGGVARALGKKVLLEGGQSAPEASDFFLIDISDPFQSLELWQRELHSVVNTILVRTRAPRLVLVGFSAGGVAARKYLVEHPADHRIAKLVTIASPHLGSELALVNRVDAAVRKAIDDGRLSEQRAKEYESIGDRLQEVSGLRIDGPLLNELIPPKHEGVFLEELNRSPHPTDITDIEYGCLVTTGSAVDLDTKKLQAEIATLRGFVFTRSIVGEKLLSILMSWIAGEAGGADGVVRSASQHLGRIDAFRQQPELLKKVDVIPASHFAARSWYQAVVKAIAGPAKILDLELSEDSKLHYDAIESRPPGTRENSGIERYWYRCRD